MREAPHGKYARALPVIYGQALESPGGRESLFSFLLVLPTISRRKFPFGVLNTSQCSLPVSLLNEGTASLLPGAFASSDSLLEFCDPVLFCIVYFESYLLVFSQVIPVFHIW